MGQVDDRVFSSSLKAAAMRKKLILFFLLIGITDASLFAGRMERILDATTQKVHRIKVIPSSNKIFLPNEYNSHRLKKAERLDELEDRVVLGIDFVYTSYAEVSSFDQRALNRKRLKTLKEKAPELIEDPTIRWRKVVQTGASSPEEGKAYFHGFRITLRPSVSQKNLKKEKRFLRKALNNKGPFAKMMEACKDHEGGDDEGDEDDEEEGGEEASLSDLDEKEEDTVKIEDYEDASVEEIAGIEEKGVPFGTAPRFKGGKYKFFSYLEKHASCPGKSEMKEKGGMSIFQASFVVAPSGMIMVPSIENGRSGDCPNEVEQALSSMPSWKPGKHQGKPVMTQVIITLSYSRAKPSVFIDTIKRVSMNELAKGDTSFYSESLTDSLSQRALSYPFFSAGGYDPGYIQECGVLEILRRNQNDWEDMLVVCDVTGSMTPYIAQLMLWYKGLLEQDRFENEGFHLTLFGDGPNAKIHHARSSSFDSIKSSTLDAFGGGTENNSEGTLEGMKEASDAKDIVMIADNYEPPVDLQKWSKVDRPVHIVLCGTEGGVNPTYIEMVRENGGTLHTIEQDLETLGKMEEGESVSIQGRTYTIKGAEWVDQ